MAQLDVSEALNRYGAFISENRTLSIFIVVGLLIFSYFSVGASRDNQNLPAWIPLEIGAASFLLTSGGRGLSI
jgi:hypothetical protein